MMILARYPNTAVEDHPVACGRAFCLQGTIDSRLEALIWVKLVEGKKQQVVGQIQEGDRHGMIIFIDGEHRDVLVKGHFAIVMVDKLETTFGFSTFQSLLLREEDLETGVVTAGAIPGEYPMYQADHLDDAKSKHLARMEQLLNRCVQKRQAEIESTQLPASTYLQTSGRLKRES